VVIHRATGVNQHGDEGQRHENQAASGDG
jgi:hypothetical protein